jgi:hypothetical protein
VGCDAVRSRRCIPALRRNILSPPSRLTSALKIEELYSSETSSIYKSSQLHNTEENVIIFPAEWISNLIQWNIFDSVIKRYVINFMFEDDIEFWDISPLSFVEVDRIFIGAYCLHLQGDWNASLLQRDYTALYSYTSWNTRRCSGFKIKWKNSSGMFVTGFWIFATPNLVGIG